MKVRLTQIGLHAGAKKFAIGDTVEPSEETGVTAEYLAGLVKRGLAELASAEGVSAEVTAEIGALHERLAALHQTIILLVELGERGDLDDAIAIVEALGATAPEEMKPYADRLFQLERRVEVERVKALAADYTNTNPEGVSPVAQGEAGSSTPAPAGGSVDGRTPPENSDGATGAPAPADAASPLGSSEEATGASADGAEAGDSSASNDTAPAVNGADGEAGAAAPADPAAQPAEAKKPARKGGAKSG